jgi:DNA primase
MAAMATPVEQLDVDGTDVRLSNPDKIYFPALGADGGTKRHLVEYYRAVATLDGGSSIGTGASGTSVPPVLRALRDRPTYLQRFPDGVEGEEVYQKRLPVKRRSTCSRAG